MFGLLSFSDGSCTVSIKRREDGTFTWINDDQKGTAATWKEAWENLPASVTDPDHWEESELYEC